MKQWIGLLAVALFGGSIFAVPVDAEMAKRVAFAFAKQNLILAEHTEGVGEATTWENVWVVPLKPSGYVVVERDDIRPPVIAFGKEDFPENPAPPMASLLERPAVEEGLTTFSTLSATPAHEEWAILLSPNSGLATLSAASEPPSSAAVQKVGSIKDFTYAWNQCLPYNLYAPGLSYARMGDYGSMLYGFSSGGYGMRSTCGCTATAISQVAAWFQWPYALRGMMRSEWEDNGDGGFATQQVAAPGKPYNWKALATSTVPKIEDTDGEYGEEVGRFVQHWATLLKVQYMQTGSSGALPTDLRPQLSLLAGYKVVSPECVSMYRMVYTVEGENAGWSAEPKTELKNWEAVYASFAKMIYEYQIPVPTGIPMHYIVCFGWAEDVDAELSADTRYAKLNYGWGPSGGMNGWFAIRTVSGEGDGEAIPKDNKIFLLESFAILPLQCGEIVNLAAQDQLSKTLSWYESPYWIKRYPNPEVTTRALQVVTFDTTATTNVKLDLNAAAKSDANWTYTDETKRLALDHTRAQLSSAVIFPELVKAASAKLTVEVALERLVATYKEAKEYTEEKDLEPITGPIPDAVARDLLVALEDTATGTVVASQKVTLGTDMSVESGTVVASFDVEKGKVFRVLLMSGKGEDGPPKTEEDEEGEDEEPSISLETLAYTVAGVTVKDCYAGKKTPYAFETIDFPKKEDEPGTLTVGTLSEEDVNELNTNANTEMWLAVTISTPTEPETTDALWTPLTIAERVEPPVVAFTSDRFFLNDVDDPISFTMTGKNIDSVKAYLSQASWLNADSRDGFEVITLSEDARKEVDGRFTFTLAGRANVSGEDKDDTAQVAEGSSPAEEKAPLDTLTLDSYESVGRDAVVSLCVTDKAGNEAWTHARVTWGLSDGIIELITEQDRKMVTLYLTRLLFASTYAGCYKKNEGEDKKKRPVIAKDDSEETKLAIQEAMAVVEDAMRLGYLAPVDSEQTPLFSQTLLEEVLMGDKTFKPRVEVLSLSPTEIIFNVSDDLSTPETLAEYVNTAAITVEGGETLDAIVPLEGMTVTRNSDGTYTLKVPEGKTFFQIKL